MDQKNKGQLIAALAVGLSAGAIGSQLVPGGQEPSPEFIGDSVLLNDELVRKLTESEAEGVVSCARGIVSNKPADAVYCQDGAGAGFMLDDCDFVGAEPVRVYLRDGKAYLMVAQ